MAELDGLRVAVLTTDDVEEPELMEPMRALKDAGAQVTVASPPKTGEIQAVRHDLEKTIKIKADRSSRRSARTISMWSCSLAGR